jgi:hypothetical protein
VIEYLGRYTHRVAIDNRRLLSIDDGWVSFQYKDYRAKAAHKSRSMTVSADEFIRRFLLHALPPGFVRIRHYGLLASRAKKILLPLCRRLLGGQTLDWLLTPAQIGGSMQPAIEPFFPCPVCGIGSMLRIEKIRITPHPWTDSS